MLPSLATAGSCGKFPGRGMTYSTMDADGRCGALEPSSAASAARAEEEIRERFIGGPMVEYDSYGSSPLLPAPPYAPRSARPRPIAGARVRPPRADSPGDAGSPAS